MRVTIYILVDYWMSKTNFNFSHIKKKKEEEESFYNNTLRKVF
jgi:hypothetical protein